MATFRIPISNGLLTPEHVRAIGPALWEFVWFVDHTTREYDGDDGQKWGEVNGGREVTSARIAEDLGLPRETVKGHLERLLDAGYIQSERGSRGCRYRVAKSKRGFSDGSNLTHQADRAKLTHQTTSDRAKLTHPIGQNSPITCRNLTHQGVPSPLYPPPPPVKQVYKDQTTGAPTRDALTREGDHSHICEMTGRNGAVSAAPTVNEATAPPVIRTVSQKDSDINKLKRRL